MYPFTDNNFCVHKKGKNYEKDEKADKRAARIGNAYPSHSV